MDNFAKELNRIATKANKCAFFELKNAFVEDVLLKAKKMAEDGYFGHRIDIFGEDEIKIAKMSIKELEKHGFKVIYHDGKYPCLELSCSNTND